MIFPQDLKAENIPIAHIDFNNIDFKISKPFADDRLKHSINTLGLLDPPLLCKEKNNYIIISGHNRLSVLRESADSVFSYVLDSLAPETYLDYIYLKNYRAEISSAGKIKVLLILTTKLKLNMSDMPPVARNMQIPDEFLKNDLVVKFCSLPGNLKDYIDLKDIGFKVIKNILRLPDEAILYISGWIDFSMRVNIFKNIIDLVSDIYRRDKDLEPLKNICLDSITDKRIREEYLYKEILKIRYPEYTGIKSRADAIINNIKKNNLEINFPEYFEKDEIEVVLKISKREDINKVKENFAQIDINEIKKLLDLL